MLITELTDNIRLFMDEHAEVLEDLVNGHNVLLSINSIDYSQLFSSVTQNSSPQEAIAGHQREIGTTNWHIQAAGMLTFFADLDEVIPMAA